MKRITVLLTLFIGLNSIGWSQNTGVEQIDNLEIFVRTSVLDSTNVALDEENTIMHMNLDFEIIDVANVNEVHIVISDSLGGNVAFEGHYFISLRNNEYLLQDGSVIKGVVNGDKYVYFDLPNIKLSDRNKYNVVEIWTTDSMGNETDKIISNY